MLEDNNNIASLVILQFIFTFKINYALATISIKYLSNINISIKYYYWRDNYFANYLISIFLRFDQNKKINIDRNEDIIRLSTVQLSDAHTRYTH